MGSGSGPTEATLRPDGFYEIKVNYAHGVQLADLCGLNHTAVIQSVEEDNIERLRKHKKAQQGEDN